MNEKPRNTIETIVIEIYDDGTSTIRSKDDVDEIDSDVLRSKVVYTTKTRKVEIVIESIKTNK